MSKENSVRTKRTIILYGLGFLLIFGYAFARTCIDSLFLEHYTTKDMATAWLIMSVVSFVVIAIYNNINQKFAILDLFGKLSIVCAVLLAVFLALYLYGFIPAIFILYIWKEIYMVVLVETYWSYADIVFSTKTARFAYGLALAMSSLGGVVGNLLVGPLAKRMTSAWALSLLIGFLLLGAFITHCYRHVSDERPTKATRSTKVTLGLKTLWHSKYLVPLAMVLCLIQVIIGLIDLHFNDMLKISYPTTDLRTEALGHIHALINVFAISIQVMTGPILRLLGIGTTFRSVPFFLGMSIFMFLLVPKFALMVSVKISSKTLDYSLFRGIKEMLYIPLSREEKTQGKGLIDIFVYRLARGITSVFIIFLSALGLSMYLMEISLVLIVIWIMLTIVIVKRYQELVTNEDKAQTQ